MLQEKKHRRIDQTFPNNNPIQLSLSSSIQNNMSHTLPHFNGVGCGIFWEAGGFGVEEEEHLV